MAKYTTLKIVDYSADIGEQILDTFILKNPDVEKLNQLKYSIETRYDNGDEHIIDWAYIYDYINNNFETINTEYYEIEW